MTVDEYLALSCSRKGLNPMEHFVRVKKRRDMEDHNYFVPHRTDSIETYVSIPFNVNTYSYIYLINLTNSYFYLATYSRSCRSSCQNPLSSRT